MDKTWQRQGKIVESRPSLPTLLFVAFVFSINIFALFTVITVGRRSESHQPPRLAMTIGAQHPQQRELSWDGGEADGDGGGEGGVAPKDSEPHSIRLAHTMNALQTTQGDPS